ncbi:MAG TPA: acyltransferase [Candidatus Binataceae bacterium]|nr:acyltransferase [Candidatus Binataceae bacterium]
MGSSATTLASGAPNLGSQPVAHATSRGYNAAIGYLRGFLVILVLAHHSAVAYFWGVPTSRAPLLKVPMFWRAFPIVDPHAHSALLTLFISFNDTFFMSLMFFVSGLFVWPSLVRKGNTPFLRNRFKRLGIPFLFAAAIVAPLAYYPSYLMAGGRGVAGYVHDWLSFGDWPTGPAWFIWLLLAFDLAAGAIFVFAPGFGDALSELVENGREHPVRLFAMFVVASMAAYVPMVAVFGPLAWVSIGPFQFQTARLFHYAVYFLAGIGVGAYGIDRGLLAPDGKLARHWGRWTLAMLVIFVASIAFSLMAISQRSPLSPGTANVMGGFVFALTCGAISFAVLALFVRLITRSNPIFDSLSDNEYGMYLIHYMFVSWLQMALLAIALGPITKTIAVFSGVLLLSWGTSAGRRRASAIRRIV